MVIALSLQGINFIGEELKKNIDRNNELTKNELNLIYSQIVSLAQGNFSGQVTEAIKSGALTYKNLLSISHGAKAVLFFCAIIATFLFAYNKINKNVHARDGVEKIFTTVLFLSSVAAILTTAGIIFSLLFETIQFFTKINPLDFFSKLSQSNLAPEAFMIRDKNFSIISCSPENLITKKGSEISTKPIAGTVKKTKTLKHFLAVSLQLMHLRN